MPCTMAGLLLDDGTRSWITRSPEKMACWFFEALLSRHHNMAQAVFSWCLFAQVVNYIFKGNPSFVRGVIPVATTTNRWHCRC